MLSANTNDHRPLAARMRPQTLTQFVGQQHLLAKGKPLFIALEGGNLHSMILWGSPGVGKTTLAQLLAQRVDAQWLSLSAVLAGVKDIRAAVEQAKSQPNIATVLFVDEIHRFNKAQQDALLPHVEEGVLQLIGATTENPSFSLNNALLSRARVYVLQSLDSQQLDDLITTALGDVDRGLGKLKLKIDDDARKLCIAAADGDARQLLNLLELAADFADNGSISLSHFQQVMGHQWRQFDKDGEIFYDQISALHKSVRGSSPDAALYWLARLLDGGCDPLYVARRVLRMASEDIGNADPRALQLCAAAWQTLQCLGSPEGELALAQAVVYLATAAKSNAVYVGFQQAMDDAKKSGSLPVPLHLRNAPTQLMKELDYGKHYRYPHDEQDGYVAGEQYFPNKFPSKHYYHPVDRGLEIKIQEKLNWLRQKDS